MIKTYPTTLMAALLARLAQAQLQLLNVTSDELSATCVAVLNQQVVCDSTLTVVADAVDGRLYGTPLFLSSDELVALCTTTCARSLTVWETRIAGACGNTLYNRSDGSQYALASFAQQYIEIYDTACLENSDGEYCNAVIGELLGINVTNQQATATPTSSYYCNDCYLSLLSTQLAMPMASTTLLGSAYTALTSACSSTGWTMPTAPTATTFTVPAPATTATSVCNGTTYEVTSSDTCIGISMAEGISTDDLCSYNGLPSMCYAFPSTGTELCIPDARKCEPYTLTGNDTCASLQSQHGIYYSQLMSWNPSLGPKCNNIAAYVGYVLCISNPGGAWVNPSPAGTTTTTSSSTMSSLWASTLTPMESWPTATYVASSEVAGYANGTRMDCATYVTAPILTNYTGNGTTSLDCQDVVDQYGILMSDFMSWNPSLSNTTTDSSGCVMTNNTQYCVQTYDMISQNITDYCTQTEIAPSGYDCYKFTSMHGIESDQFFLWNPELGTDCENFAVGTKYCIAVNHYRQPGITTNCNQYARANQTDWVEEPCQIIETEFGLSHARFVAWNPAVADNCTGLYVGYDYCVSIPNYRPTYTTTSAAYTSDVSTTSVTASITSSA